ncbi:hypothetical protein [Microlunatus antarcticus]|uniref:Uncharacterized protein n=1 Tax=Microlunatus antarcticus TaxID=53388 RepID=A0A7W5P6G4_9ACTN|nr:hypothetical protein [Microlunatus antarcticus]MBB3326408.1 hypothetical protein [Microlunatus antarcticus]
MAARLRTALEAGVAVVAGPDLHADDPGERGLRQPGAGGGRPDPPASRFYDWDRTREEERWMTAWDTTEADVDSFLEVIGSELINSR